MESVLATVRAAVRVSWWLLAAGFAQKFAYRLATLGSLAVNLTFGALNRSSAV